MSYNHSLPLVSIVIPSYNQGIFLEETILSILEQDYPRIDLIVIDGGSSDASVEIIKKYQSQIAYWVSESDQGQADAINKGWLRSKGEYMGWLNSDDILNPGAISLAIDYFQEHSDVGFIYGDLTYIDEVGNFLATHRYQEFDIFRIIKETGYISQPGSLFRRSVFEKVGMLDTSLHFQMDADYWIRAGFVCKFGHISEPLACFRRHSASKTSTMSDLAAKDILVIYNKIFSCKDLPLDIKSIESEARSSAHLYSANAWLAFHEPKMAFDEMILATKLFPKIILKKKFLKLFLSLAIINIFSYNFFQRLKNIKKAF